MVADRIEITRMHEQSAEFRRIISDDRFPMAFSKSACYDVRSFPPIIKQFVQSKLSAMIHSESSLAPKKHSSYCLFVGDRRAGKTKIIQTRYAADYPWTSLEPTTFVKVKKFKYKILNYPVNLRTVEMPGYDEYPGPPLEPLYHLPVEHCRISCIVLVFTYKSASSLAGMRRWYREYIRDNFIRRPDDPCCPWILLVGTDYNSALSQCGHLRYWAFSFAHEISAEYWSIDEGDEETSMIIELFDRIAVLSFIRDMVREYHCRNHERVTSASCGSNDKQEFASPWQLWSTDVDWDQLWLEESALYQ